MKTYTLTTEASTGIGYELPWFTASYRRTKIKMNLASRQPLKPSL